MTDIRDLYRTIGNQHCRLGQSYLTLAEHPDLAGNPEPRPESEPPPEMTVHAPSTVPPEAWANDGPGAALSATGIERMAESIRRQRGTELPDHVHELGSCSHCDRPPMATPPNNGITHYEGMPPSDSPALDDTPSPASGTRRRTDYTAAEWATSAHFLAYMKKAPFSNWTAEEQNAKRDEFTAMHKDSPRQNRWGKAFAKFCGVTS